MEGILLIDKPAGWTSFDVVNYVRRMVATIEDKRPKHVKVGHTGTLDPAATGLLVILVGKNYTRLAQAMTKHDKTYEVQLTLGAVSTTGDSEGDITNQEVAKEPLQADILAALRQFTGEIMQTPPAFSAIKIDGQRAYDLARKGKEVKIEPRPVVIYSCQLTGYTYPHVEFIAEVGSGTYIRSLAEDIGTHLQTGAYMSSLRRSRVGIYDIADAVDPKALTPEMLHQRLLQLPDITTSRVQG